MTEAKVNRDLLFGVLALQMNVIGRDAFVAALGDWLGDRSRSLAKVRIEQAGLSAAQRTLVETARAATSTSSLTSPSC